MVSSQGAASNKESVRGMLTTAKVLLQTYGAIPFEFKNNYHHLISLAIFWFYIGCTSTLFAANAISTYKRSIQGNLAGFFESLSFTTVVADGILKYVFIQGQFVKDIITRVEQHEETIRANPEHNKIYNKRSTFAEKLTNFCLPAVACSLLYLLTRPLYTTVQKMDGTRGRRLITAYWYPIDPEKHYTAAYLTEVVLMITTSQDIIFSDVFVCTLLYSCVSQLEVIHFRLRNINQDSLKMAQEEGISLQQAQMVVTKDIAVCHQKMIAMVKDIDNALRWYLLSQFLMSSFRVALTVFDVFWRDMELMELVGEYVYVVQLSVEIAIYYYIANDIMLYSSDGIFNAVAMSDYEELCSSARLMLVTILSAAKRPLTLSVGHFDAVTINTLLKIVKSGYYALSILNNLEAKSQKLK